MEKFKKAKLAVDTLRNYTSKISSKAPSQQSRIYQNGFSSSSDPAKFSPVSERLGLGFQMGAKNLHSCYNPLFGNVGKRFYYVDRHQVYHFKPRGPQRWFQNPKNVLTVVLVGSGVLITVYFGNLETVPYTKRTHFVLLSQSMEKKIGESQFEQIKAGFKGKILPAIHPDSVRIRLIAKDIVEALQRGLSTEENVWSDLGYASSEVEMKHVGIGNADKTVRALSEREGNVKTKWNKDDENLDDNWVKDSRKKGKERGSKAQTSHLYGLNWEVLVVNEPVINAVCLPGGKIIVFKGLLEHFQSDAEIATIIGHEVAHAVARHIAEGITKNLWFAILQLVLYQFFWPDLVNTMSSLFLRLPFSRRMEIEADYIGLLLMASAGYDPRVAPKVFEKLAKVTGDSALRDYLSTHPSGKKRAQLLAQAHVMEEALFIYRDRIAGEKVEGFFL